MPRPPSWPSRAGPWASRPEPRIIAQPPLRWVEVGQFAYSAIRPVPTCMKGGGGVAVHMRSTSFGSFGFIVAIGLAAGTLVGQAPTCFSLPAFWNSQTRTGPEQWRPVTVDSVHFPCKKGVLANFADAATSWANYTLAGSSPDIGWIDGSAASVRHDELAPPYGPAEGQWGGPPTPFGRVIMHTVDGVRGTDR